MKLARYLGKVKDLLVGGRRDDPTYSDHFNPPVKFIDGGWYVNERLIERAFVLCHLGLEGSGRRVLDVGCTRSDLAMQLAGLGYEVTGVDLRPFGFSHPRLRFEQVDVRDLEDDGFDAVVALSVLEHVGLGAYTDEPDEEALEEFARRLAELPRPGGQVLVTVPFGEPSVDDFQRSFSRSRLLNLFPSLDLEEERYYRRTDHRHWSPVDLSEAEKVSNLPEDRGPTGANCVGCFKWIRPTDRKVEE